MEKEIMGFPFKLIGEGLRWLSLQGGIWDLLAWVLYIGISLVPIAYLLYKVKVRRVPFCGADFWLVLISLSLFAVLYIMINPGILPEEYLLMGGVEFCVTLWSEIVLYLVLVMCKAVKAAKACGEARLLQYLRLGMIVLAVALAAFSVLGIFTELLPEIEAIRNGNSSAIDDLSWELGMADPLEMSAMGMWMVYLLRQISVVAEIVVIRYGLKLLRAIEADRYSDATIAAAKNLGDVCLTATIVIAVMPLLINLLQLGWSGLHVLQYQYTLPIVPILMIVGVYLLAHYFAADKAVKEENDMFI